MEKYRTDFNEINTFQYNNFSEEEFCQPDKKNSMIFEIQSDKKPKLHESNSQHSFHHYKMNYSPSDFFKKSNTMK